VATTQPPIELPFQTRGLTAIAGAMA